MTLEHVIYWFSYFFVMISSSGLIQFFSQLFGSSPLETSGEQAAADMANMMMGPQPTGGKQYFLLYMGL
jgi:hypothetical protein